MARGWESKNIESQQEEALAAREVKPALTAEERARLEQRQAIELALAAKRSELANATSDAHRAYLTRAINDLTAILNS
ncbi:MAG TPA: hypothetical protein VFZ36_04875 [Vicinamibacterales bacterium]